MVPYSKIEDAVRILAEVAHPEKIVLFGSYARGEPSQDSDVDLLIIVREPVNKAQEMVRLRRVLRPLRIAVDLLVCSVGGRGALRDMVRYGALQCLAGGKVLHDITY